MHQYNQTRRVPRLHAGVGGMAGLQTEVAQLQNGDVVRLAAGREGAWAAGANIWF